MYSVYRLRTLGMGSNAYGVARDEQWSMKKDKMFQTLADAQQYVLDQSRLHTELPRFLVDVAEKDRDRFIWEFCLGEGEAATKYLKYRRLFIGVPPIKAIEKALKEDGIRVSMMQ